MNRIRPFVFSVFAANIGSKLTAFQQYLQQFEL
jgi:hypothetical protein